MKPRMIVFISGGGSNLQALMDATQSGKLEAEIALVVSNRKAAFGLERAKNAGLETLYFPLKPYKDAGKSRAEYDADLAQAVSSYAPDLIVLAGWMHIDSGALVKRFPGRIINLHPALPGEFPGAHGIEDAFAAWQRGEITRSGCMVHHVIEELDAGEPIATRVVEFKENDTLETYAERIHAAEHELIVEVTKKSLKRVFESQYVEEARALLSQTGSPEEVLDFLRKRGFWITDCIKVLQSIAGLPLGDAKGIVHLSQTWADLRIPNDALHDEVTRIAQEFVESSEMQKN